MNEGYPTAAASWLTPRRIIITTRARRSVFHVNRAESEEKNRNNYKYLFFRFIIIFVNIITCLRSRGGLLSSFSVNVIELVDPILSIVRTKSEANILWRTWWCHLKLFIEWRH